jgi:uncharacterized protein
MMMFVDTWGWVSLADVREQQHKTATQHYRAHRLQRGQICTTDYVLDETITLLTKKRGITGTQIILDILQQATRDGFMKLVWMSEEHFQRAIQLRLRFQDKPDISFTDLTSMVVMQEFGIRQILTADAHFQHVGLGFQTLPNG